MDHTHCFTCGRDLNVKVATVDRVKDDRLYGLFPGFMPKVRQDEVEAGIVRLKELDQTVVDEIVATIPADWEVSEGARNALKELICRRASYVAENMLAAVGKACWPGQLFDNAS